MNYDIQLDGIYVNEKITNEFPKKELGLNFEKIICSDNATASFDSIDWSLTIGNLTSASSCKIYFTGETNPQTGSFFNILLISSIIIISLLAIKKLFTKNKFYKI